MLEKIKALYPELKPEDFFGRNATIQIQDDSDGNGAYIAKWEHPTLPEPTAEQLA